MLMWFWQVFNIDLIMKLELFPLSVMCMEPSLTLLECTLEQDGWTWVRCYITLHYKDGKKSWFDLLKLAEAATVIVIIVPSGRWGVTFTWPVCTELVLQLSHVAGCVPTMTSCTWGWLVLHNTFLVQCCIPGARRRPGWTFPIVCSKMNWCQRFLMSSGGLQQMLT